MKVTKTTIEDVLIFEPTIIGDERGYFCETFRDDVFKQHIGKVLFVQDNESKSMYGVLRGLHYQKPPFTQSKLVRVLNGKVIDVAIDIRIGSPTFGKHVAVILSNENKRVLWVPKGFAHGYCVLSQEAVFSYKVDEYYSPKHDAGLAWDDEQLNIDWCIDKSDIVLSDKDKNQPSLKSIKVFHYENSLKNDSTRYK
jgi:dTDP-4-dehydrorhamnose 3,5-epimerase